MKFAIIKNNIVENIIKADQKFILDFYPDAINVDQISCGIGWSYDGKTFTEPIVEEIEKSVDAETL